MPGLTKYQDLINNKPVHIATVTPDCGPNLAVASDVLVLDDEHLLISVNEMAHTQKNIQLNPKVVITAFDEDWKGVRVFGMAEFYESGEYYDLCQKEFFSEGGITPFGATKPRGAIVVEVTKTEKYV